MDGSKISIITPTYNSAKTIADTINSVLSQDYPHIQHIIIDNQSKDATLEIIETYKPQYADKQITLAVSSQPDNGIYDGMNRGIALSDGEIIGFLNSDDFFTHSGVLSTIAKGFDDWGIDCVFGDLEYVDFATLKTKRYWKSSPYAHNAFQQGWHPPHPTFYAKKHIYKMYGNFSLAYKIAADYEIMFRFLQIHQIHSKYIPQTFVKMRLGGKSNQSFKNILLANFECLQAWRDNGVSPPLRLIPLKLLKKIMQYFNH
ncbi:glycosyltransferase family 2 protein [Helicobacter sp. 11S03491-1]|uniref:glycosyltransferase family 2 protein n=1 Tax=Helicobacter sp. 11S03491-1 TaxID=1476196 RepID=UPI000BA685A7|nr:glycosyltransferase family 2 protein [Helicobacter sp. 11S03491-1]PAF43796.1 glycosyl transferase [Helicobacter sp. 11S03491-1]